MVAGRGIVRNYGRNNNSPATASSLLPRFTTAGRCNSKVSPMLAVYQSVSKKECRILRSSMDGGYPEVHLRLPLALLERHTTATAESTNNINTSRSAALPAARLP